MSLFKCRICGKEFDRVGNGVYCNGPHFRPCPVCGKPVEFQRPSEPLKCCSADCRRVLASQSKNKVKKCVECGREFTASQASQIYCKGPHTAVCVICGKSFEYTVRPSEKPQTCSRQCQEKLRSQTAQQRYGVANVSQLESVRKKISERNGSEEVAEKRRATSRARWGVDNPAQNPEIAKKMSETMSSAAYLNKREATCVERYGHKSPMMASAIKQKQRDTNIAKYGMMGHPHTREDLQRMMLDGSKVDDYIAFRDDPRGYIESHFDDLPNISELESALGVTNTPIYNTLIGSGCRDLLSSSFSIMEDEVVSFLQSLDANMQIVRGDRTQISPWEIDIYLPEYRIGIECNPVATHNSSFADPWGSPPKYKNYHKIKSDKATEHNVFLFHLFGYEWYAKQDIMKSMIVNLLHHNSMKVGARSTYVTLLDASECRRFLDTNHRQGNCSASVRLGLKITGTDELVSVMTFGKMRHTMGASKHTEGIWELSRFCNKLNTSVAGGASKLFRYFISHYSFDAIVSFSDVSHTRGKLYDTLGFHTAGQVPPSYTWVDKYDRMYYNRVSTQKQYLPKLLHDDSIDISACTEKDIMEAHGFAQVYDSGKLKWEYVSQNLK